MLYCGHLETPRKELIAVQRFPVGRAGLQMSELHSLKVFCDMKCSCISAADSLEEGRSAVIMKKNGPDRVALVLN